MCGRLNACFAFIVVYYDVPNRKARQDKSKPADIEVVMNFTNSFATARFWEVRVTQIPFSQRAPTGCLQYFFGNDGIIQVPSSDSCALRTQWTPTDSFACPFVADIQFRREWPAFIESAV